MTKLFALALLTLTACAAEVAPIEAEPYLAPEGTRALDSHELGIVTRAIARFEREHGAIPQECTQRALNMGILDVSTQEDMYAHTGYCSVPVSPMGACPYDAPEVLGALDSNGYDDFSDVAVIPTISDMCETLDHEAWHLLSECALGTPDTEHQNPGWTSWTGTRVYGRSAQECL